ncbi:hypothetical protein [Terriglobus sp. ADX1]
MELQDHILPAKPERALWFLGYGGGVMETDIETAILIAKNSSDHAEEIL